MGALSAIEAAVVDGPESAAPGAPAQQAGRPAPRLVRPAEMAGVSWLSGPGGDRVEPRSSSIQVAVPPRAADRVLTPSAVIPPRPRGAVGSAPLRLTRRGRAVVAALVVAVVAALALVIAVGVVGGAQAAGHDQPASRHQGMHEIVVQSGQSLWSIASAAEPTADPRLVVQQIMAANGLATADVAAGQQLWVPR